VGIVLSVMDYKDADCLVEIFSRDLGKNLFIKVLGDSRVKNVGVWRLLMR